MTIGLIASFVALQLLLVQKAVSAQVHPGHDMAKMETQKTHNPKFMDRNPISIAPKDCTEMEVWDVGMGMCMPLPMADMPMSMVMVCRRTTGPLPNSISGRAMIGTPAHATISAFSMTEYWPGLRTR